MGAGRRRDFPARTALTGRTSPKFVDFGRRIRPMLASQENKILKAAPWSPKV